MITKQRYVEYLLATPINSTCTNLADHLDGVSHDAVSDYLRRERHTARRAIAFKSLWSMPFCSTTYLHACDETAFASPIWLLSLLSRPDERTRAGLFRTVGWCGSYL